MMPSTIPLDLLKEIVLLMAHHKITLFLALFELILQRLGVDSNTTVTNNLLASVGSYRSTR